MQEDEALDGLIDFLNQSKEEFMPKHKIKKQKSQSQSQMKKEIQQLKQNFKPKNQGESKDRVQQDADQDDAIFGMITQEQNFSDIYEKRQNQIQKKNQAFQKNKKKKQEMMEKAKKLHESPNVPKISGTSKQVELLSLPSTIRHLIFKPWSGNHMNYQIKDNGYKFRFTNGVVALVKHTLEENGYVESTDKDGSILWNIGVVQPATFQGMGAYMKINHFPKSYEITRKDLMLQNLSKMRARYATHYNFYPKTYILPNESGHFMEDTEKTSNSKKGGNQQWYIIKPSNKSQGRGIWLSDRPEQILQKQKDSLVVSQYIANPLLVKGLKFDMRIYVGITCWNPLRIYVFENGLARFATSQYTNLNGTMTSSASSSTANMGNLLAHLTNYSLNKNSENFVANDDQAECKGHKWSLLALKDYLNKQMKIDVDLVWTRINDMIIKTIISIQNKVFSAMEMSVPYRDNCFQILGFDVLIDDTLRPWLIQINLSPSLNTDSQLDLSIKGSMLADMFTMIGIVSNEQRFSHDKSHIINEQSNNKTVKSIDHARLANFVVKQSQQERKRSGGWTKIFPTQTATRYKQFFDIDRPLNRLLREQEIKKFKHTNPGVNVNQFLAKGGGGGGGGYC